MSKVTLEVDDDFLEQFLAPGIMGPRAGDADRTAWLLVLPGEDPCICDSFEEAAEGMRQWLKPRVRRRSKR